MAKKKSAGPTELERLHEWLGGVGGNFAFGAASLESVEASKSGNKVTIVLKKPKPAKAEDGGTIGQKFAQ